MLELPIDDPPIRKRPALHRARRLVVALTALATAMILVQPASASDTATRWDRMSESSGCDDPFTRTPVVSKQGHLSNSEAILGPFGTYFGRTISEIRSKLVTWKVPNSGGMEVKVHEEVLPSLQQVTKTLRAHAEQGRVYEIDSADAFTPRTIGGRYHVSRHAMGLAIDINPAQNPYRDDATLITDMPDWFVDAWRDAGFCWGGDWRGSKDAMHFSWTGPGATPQSDQLEPIPPRTAKTNFGPAESHTTEFGPVSDRYLFTITDANSNGAPDVVGLRDHGSGGVADIALSSRGYGYCSIGRWHVPDLPVETAEQFIFGDVDGDSGGDIIMLSDSGDDVVAHIATRRNAYEGVDSLATGASADAVAVTAADFDADHHADLWEATPDGKLKIWAGPAFFELLDESDLPGGPPISLAAGDRDGGDRPELYALYEETGSARMDVLTHSGSWVAEASISTDANPADIAAIGAGDYDGDGRSDAQVLTRDGTFEVFVGNSPTGIPADRWFLYPETDCDDPVLLDYDGRFMDDDTSIFEADIESIAGAGVTKGCNPPFNDRFCPEDSVSRQEMAAFLVRALGLAGGNHPGFSDVPDGSTFEEDIARLAAAGITKGCNPPDNDRFCPDEAVTRGQMAAFLVRALNLTESSHQGFDDVPGAATFAGDIARLATAGITKGCNPPDNDRFCPDEAVTRGQMAAFLDRAGLGER